jgi:hypothetical protein
MLHNTQRQTDLLQGPIIDLVALQYCARVPQRLVHTTCTQTQLIHTGFVVYPISYKGGSSLGPPFGVSSFLKLTKAGIPNWARAKLDCTGGF